jgi:hypothetical protein
MQWGDPSCHGLSETVYMNWRIGCAHSSDATQTNRLAQTGTPVYQIWTVDVSGQTARTFVPQPQQQSNGYKKSPFLLPQQYKI